MLYCNEVVGVFFKCLLFFFSSRLLFEVFGGEVGSVVFKYVGSSFNGESACFLLEKRQSWVLPDTVRILDHATCRFSVGLLNF